MLSPKQLQEIKEKLENSQNPLFFFDNDGDGLCAFLLLRRALDRGKGVPSKTRPDLKEQYLRKVNELNPDLIIILDIPEVSKEFIEGAEERNIPIVWIDHHKTEIPEEIKKKLNYYNSIPSAEPTTYIAQKVFNNKKDIWLAMIGCANDVYMPEFAKDFEKQYPELFNSKIPIFDSLYSTELGKITRMLNMGLMDTTTNVVNLMKYMFKAKTPYDILEENRHTKQLHKKYNELNKFFNKQIEKAEKAINPDSKLIFYSFSGETSMSSEIANKLYFDNKDKTVVVAFKKPDKANVSIRGKKALEITKKAIKDIEGATGGGHQVATGATIPIDEFENFKKKIKEIVA